MANKHLELTNNIIRGREILMFFLSSYICISCFVVSFPPLSVLPNAHKCIRYQVNRSMWLCVWTGCDWRKAIQVTCRIPPSSRILCEKSFYCIESRAESKQNKTSLTQRQIVGQQKTDISVVFTSTFFNHFLFRLYNVQTVRFPNLLHCTLFFLFVSQSHKVVMCSFLSLFLLTFTLISFRWQNRQRKGTFSSLPPILHIRCEMFLTCRCVTCCTLYTLIVLDLEEQNEKKNFTSKQALWETKTRNTCRRNCTLNYSREKVESRETNSICSC